MKLAFGYPLLAAIARLQKGGYTVERTMDVPGFPGLYRINDGPEITERQLIGLSYDADVTET